MWYAGSTEQANAYADPYRRLGPISKTGGTQVPVTQLSNYVGTGLGGPLCVFGYNRMQFPLGLQVYNSTALRQAYTVFNQTISAHPQLNQSVIVFETYAVAGLRQYAAEDSAYAHRADNLLV